MQTLNQVNLKDCIGKKIKAIEIDYNSHIIVYDDKTFSHFVEYTEWDSTCHGDITFVYQELINDIDICDDGTVFLSDLVKMFIDCGIIDEQKLIEDTKEYYEEIKKQDRENKYKLYQKLKKELEE